MISDVLSKAIQEIEEYQRTLPDTYDDLWDRIQNVKKVMTELREHLDCGVPHEIDREQWRRILDAVIDAKTPEADQALRAVLRVWRRIKPVRIVDESTPAPG